MADDGVGAGPAPVEHDGPDFHKYEALFAEHSKEIASFPSEVLSVNEEKKELRALDRTLFVRFYAPLLQPFCTDINTIELRTPFALLKSHSNPRSPAPQPSVLSWVNFQNKFGLSALFGPICCVFARNALFCYHISMIPHFGTYHCRANRA